MTETASQQTETDISRQAPSFAQKLLLLIFSLAMCAVAFVVLDAAYSFVFRKSAVPTPAEIFGCLAPDPIRDLSLQPYCSCTRAWGHERYALNVDSQGFRDQEVRQVPLTDPRPRLLMLGDSFTESMGPWDTSFVGRIAAKYPQYEVLNGGVGGYSPSNYLNTARIALKSGLDFDEAIVFMDISDVQDEAALFSDIDESGAVRLAPHQYHYQDWYSHLRKFVSKYLVLTNYVWEFVERLFVGAGVYHLDHGFNGNVFNLERSGWTYRKVVEDQPFELGFAPLGVEGGIAKEKRKMDQLYEELAKRNIPISVVVYPWPAQMIYDKVDSREVEIWRDWCQGKCKRFIDIFPEFFAEKEKCPKLEPGCWYLRNWTFGDIHLNANGNAIVADAVNRNLEATPPVKHAAIAASGRTQPR
ncbi:MAG TPA: SGNH/GDSL hydrolase family protein [Bryocella sp.]|nr:SGNH/GDSL hydrolase family protein [Bryocella sp.]